MTHTTALKGFVWTSLILLFTAWVGRTAWAFEPGVAMIHAVLFGITLAQVIRFWHVVYTCQRAYHWLWIDTDGEFDGWHGIGWSSYRSGGYGIYGRMRNDRPEVCLYRCDWKCEQWIGIRMEPTGILSGTDEWWYIEEVKKIGPFYGFREMVITDRKPRV